MAKDLTDVALKSFKPSASRREIPDGKERGLFFIVQPSGAMSWAYRYRFNGKPRKLTIGPYPLVDLKTARQRAKTAATEVDNGQDPAAAKRDAKKAAREKVSDDHDLVENVVDRFMDRYAKIKHKNWPETRRVLNNELLPKWRGRRIGEIRRADIHDILDRIVDRGAPVQANRVLTTLRKFFKWAADREIIEISPCAKVEPPTPTFDRERVLTDKEIRLAWRAFDREGWPFGDIAKLLLLTGQRRGEVAKMRWSRLDLKSQIWTIPRIVAKNSVLHRIPLSAPALRILKMLPKIKIKKEEVDSDFVFTTTGKTPVSGFSRARGRIDVILAAEIETLQRDAPGAEGLEPAERWIMHDMRRTAASRMGKLGILPHVIEAVLNHKSGVIKGVAAIYNRYDYDPEKEQALRAWGQYLELVINEKPVDNLIAKTKKAVSKRA